MNIEFMSEYPELYLRIVNEINQYQDAELHTEQIVQRVLYRIRQWKSLDDIGQLTPGAIRTIVRRASHEIMSTKRQLVVLADDETLCSYECEQTHLERYLEERDFVNEKATRLATSDREKFIFESWALGYNDSEIARTLARLYGGTIETHRRKITRFKKVVKISYAA